MYINAVRISKCMHACFLCPLDIIPPTLMAPAPVCTGFGPNVFTHNPKTDIRRIRAEGSWVPRQVQAANQ
eukprot:2917540-Karenia_brevis.AAC.1